MSFKGNNEKLRALPVQTVAIPDGIILKRGCTELKITGAGAPGAVKMILGRTANGGATIRDLRKLFDPVSAKQVDELVQQLINRRFLVASNDSEKSNRAQETTLDIFYWHFGERADSVTERPNRNRFVIIGTNFISRQLARALAACGQQNVQIYDHPHHRNAILFDEGGRVISEEWPPQFGLPQPCDAAPEMKAGDCLIVTSDLGIKSSLLNWNRVSIEHGIHYMPVILYNMIGFIGPMVIPGETPCYECFVSRQRSHMADLSSELMIEKADLDGQRPIGFHPSMAAVLGDIAAFELTRFYSATLPGRKIGRMIEINLLTPSLMERIVLKVPRCPACSPLHTKSSINLSKVVLDQLSTSD